MEPHERGGIMRSVFVLSVLASTALGCVLLARAEETGASEPRGDTRIASLRITILYNNYQDREDTEADWGFACLIEGPEKTILFDTGTRPDILMRNVEQLKVDLGKVDLIVLSHDHGDHTGGLAAVLEQTKGLPVYLPQSFPDEFVRRAEKAGATVIPVKEPTEICNGVHLTGEMGDDIPEQSLILDTAEGLVVVTGCSHPGIENIVRRAREVVDRDIYLALGGFHLMRHSEDQLKAILSVFRETGVLNCAATHCSGANAMAFFKQAYGEHYLPAGTGRVLELGRASSGG